MFLNHSSLSDRDSSLSVGGAQSRAQKFSTSRYYHYFLLLLLWWFQWFVHMQVERDLGLETLGSKEVLGKYFCYLLQKKCCFQNIFLFTLLFWYCCYCYVLVVFLNDHVPKLSSRRFCFFIYSRTALSLGQRNFCLQWTMLNVETPKMSKYQ